MLLFSQAFLPGRTLSASDYLWTAAPWRALKPEGVRGYGSNPEMADQSVVFLPFLQYTRERLPDIPLWNPHVMGGRPYLANAQSAIFSPFSVPAYVLPFWRSLAVIAFLKVFVAAFGMFLLARALSMSWPGAFLAGLVFGFGLFFIAWIPWPLSSVWAWLPWMLLLTDRLVRRPDLLAVSGLAAFTALQFLGGHPESSFHSLFGALAFFALRAVQLRAPVWRALAAFTGAIFLGAALAAVVLIPFVELLTASSDVAERGATAPTKVARKFAITVLLNDYYGRPTAQPLEGFVVERAFYIGLLTLSLVAAALLLRPNAERLAVAAFGAFSLAMVFGLEPLFSLVREAPGFGVVHNTRFTILYLLCAALLAGWGLDELSSREPPPRRARWVVAFAGLLIALPIAWITLRGRTEWSYLVNEGLDVAWGFATPEFSVRTRPIVIAGALIVLLSFALPALVLLVLRTSGRLAAGTFAALAIALIAGDLFRAGMGHNPAIPIDHARQPVTPALERVQDLAPARFAGTIPTEAIFPLVPDTAMRYGIYDARGYDYPIEKRFDRLWRRTVEPVTPFAVHTIRTPITNSSLRTLSMFGVREVMQQTQDEPLGHPGLRLVYDEEDARLYQIPRALPRAWLVGAQRLVDGEDEALEAVADRRFDPLREVIVERELPDLSAGGQARIARYGAERVVVETDADGPSLVVLSDIHYPGWKASVDGVEVDIERVDYLLRGVPVPEGSSTVEFTYEPVSFRIGWIVSLAALAGLLAAVAIGVRRRRS
ncbi:MAG: YfhO family protein [Thermoleophilaceae bacterium]